MILTVDIPDVLHRKLERRKRQTGMSKSLIVRDILESHFEEADAKRKAERDDR